MIDLHMHSLYSDGAKKMLELNLDIETIMKVTELTKEEIEKLR